MALNRSPEFKGVIVQIVYVGEIQFESAWALANISSDNICHAKLYVSEATDSEDYWTTRQCQIQIFKHLSQVVISMGLTQDSLGCCHFGPGATV